MALHLGEYGGTRVHNRGGSQPGGRRFRSCPRYCERRRKRRLSLLRLSYAVARRNHCCLRAILGLRVGGAAVSLTPEGMTGEGAHRRGALLVASAVFAL